MAKPQTYTIPPVETQIGDAHWMLTPLPATRAGEVLGDLIGILGAPIGELVAKDQDGVGKALDLLAKNLGHSGKLMPLVRVLLHDLIKDRAVKVGENTAIFDYEFRGGQLARLIPLVRWALEVNFGDFFGELVALGQKSETPALRALLRPTGSGGSSS